MDRTRFEASYGGFSYICWAPSVLKLPVIKASRSSGHGSEYYMVWLLGIDTYVSSQCLLRVNVPSNFPPTTPGPVMVIDPDRTDPLMLSPYLFRLSTMNQSSFFLNDRAFPSYR